MIAVTSRSPRTLQRAATVGVAASSVAPVASGYARSLRPCDAGVSRLSRTILAGGDL